MDHSLGLGGWIHCFCLLKYESLVLGVAAGGSVAGGLGKGRASLHIKTAGTGTWTLGGGHTILNSVRSGPLCDANLSLVSVPSFRGARTKG